MINQNKMAKNNNEGQIRGEVARVSKARWAWQLAGSPCLEVG